MKKDKIVQFVGFITNLDINEFGPSWESFAGRVSKNRVEIKLEQQAEQSRFRYLSHVIWPEEEFLCSFKDKKRTDNFPEHKVKLVQAGGYSALQVQKKPNSSNRTKITAFIGHDDRNLSFYNSIPNCDTNIYQAYYESCSYAYIYEFFVDKESVAGLLVELKKHGAEVGIYEECLVPAL